jgi:DNA-binding NarL/FixJ family response regulator
MGEIHVAVVDEHEVVRAGLETWLGTHPPVGRVSGFANHREFLDWLPGAGGIDAVVTEIQESGRAPDLDCLRMMRAVGANVIVFSRLSSAEVILRCLDAGALSYLTKSEGKDHLLQAVRRACDDESYIGPSMAEALHRRNAVGRVTLSGREREVLMAWLRTESKDEVGRMLHIAPATVRTHLQRIRVKYAQTGRPASTKSALFVLAMEDGLIGLGDLVGPSDEVLASP